MPSNNMTAQTTNHSVQTQNTDLKSSILKKQEISPFVVIRKCRNPRVYGGAGNSLHAQEWSEYSTNYARTSKTPVLRCLACVC
jgi:hypothetical protein